MHYREGYLKLFGSYLYILYKLIGAPSRCRQASRYLGLVSMSPWPSDSRISSTAFSVKWPGFRYIFQLLGRMVHWLRRERWLIGAGFLFMPIRDNLSQLLPSPLSVPSHEGRLII